MAEPTIVHRQRRQEDDGDDGCISSFLVQVEEAAAAGPMNATAFDGAEAEESKTEGRRMRSLSNEQHFRRSSGMTTGKYALSGFRQSAVTFIKIASFF